MLHKNGTTTPLDPESQEAKDALGVVLSDKDNAEKEVLSLAQTKKNLLKNIEDLKVNLEEESKTKKAELEGEITKLKTTISDLEKNKTQAENSLKTVSDENDKLLSENKSITQTNTTLKLEKQNLESVVSTLKTEFSGLKTNKDDLSSELIQSTNKLQDLNIQISSALRQKLSIETTIKEKAIALESLINALSVREDAKSKTEKEHSDIVSQITEKSASLTDLNKKLLDIQKEISDLEVKKVSTEAGIAEKMKNLSLLEERVDGKIELMKRYKEKFSTDELAKMKINIDLV